MTQNSAENPFPVRAVAIRVAGWIDKLGAVWVEGQLAQITMRPDAKTVFMVLRDPAADMSLTVTCSRDLVLSAPVKLAEGVQVVVCGKPSFYTGRGTFSLRLSEIRAVGIGELLARIDRLRRLLDAEGLFDPRLKRPIPYLPNMIGLITGRASAAERDVTTVASARWPAARFAVRNVAVQGPNAVGQIVSGTVVLRDLELEVAMDSAVTVFIPAFLRYDLRPVTGEWQIAALRAYWELPAMMLQFLRTGSGATRPALQLSRALLGNQGLGGTAGFLTGFRRAGRRHKKLVETFLNAASRADKSAAYHALSRTATMTLGEDELLDIVELFEQLRGASWTKVTGAGSTVAVSLASDHRRGIMFADVPWRGNRINRIRYFPA